MKRNAIGFSLLVALVLGLGLVVRVAAWPLVRVEIPAPAALAADAEPRLQPRFGAGTADSLTTILVSRDPFRVGRRAAAVVYDPLKVGQPDAPAPPKPVLALVGIVAGAGASALVEGFPGFEGARVVRVGDVIGGLVIKRIAGGEVRIAGMDTVWVLRVREPWR